MADLIPEDNTPPTEDIVINLDADEMDLSSAEPAEPAPAEPAPAPAATVPAEPEDPIKQALEAQRRAEDMARVAARERDEANRRAAERERELVHERTRTDDARYNSVLTAIAAEQSAIDKAEADLASAMQVGDASAVAKAQRVIAVAAARLDRLEENKADFDQQRETARQAPPPRQAPPSDPDSQIAAMAIPDNAKAWLRAHPEFVSDPGRIDMLGSAHNYITRNKNVPAFTQAYFDALDQEFGFAAAPAAAPTPSPAPAPQKRSVPVSAPVSREPPTSSGQRSSGNQITLTAEERQIARNSFGSVNGRELSPAEKERLYALNKAKYKRMLADGSYSDARHQR